MCGSNFQRHRAVQLGVSTVDVLELSLEDKNCFSVMMVFFYSMVGLEKLELTQFMTVK